MISSSSFWNFHTFQKLKHVRYHSLLRFGACLFELQHFEPPVRTWLSKGAQTGGSILRFASSPVGWRTSSVFQPRARRFAVASFRHFAGNLMVLAGSTGSNRKFALVPPVQRFVGLVFCRFRLLNGITRLIIIDGINKLLCIAFSFHELRFLLINGINRLINGANRLIDRLMVLSG